jgi:hypothetical protein
MWLGALIISRKRRSLRDDVVSLDGGLGS